MNKTWLVKAIKIIKDVENSLGKGVIEVTSCSRIWITWHNIDLGDGHFFDGLSFVTEENALKVAKVLNKKLQWKIIEHGGTK